MRVQLRFDYPDRVNNFLMPKGSVVYTIEPHETLNEDFVRQAFNNFLDVVYSIAKQEDLLNEMRDNAMLDTSALFSQPPSTVSTLDPLPSVAIASTPVSTTTPPSVDFSALQVSAVRWGSKGKPSIILILAQPATVEGKTYTMLWVSPTNFNPDPKGQLLNYLRRINHPDLAQVEKMPMDGKTTIPLNPPIQVVGNPQGQQLWFKRYALQ